MGLEGGWLFDCVSNTVVAALLLSQPQRVRRVNGLADRKEQMEVWRGGEEKESLERRHLDMDSTLSGRKNQLPTRVVAR